MTDDPALRPHDLTDDELQVAGEQTEAIEGLREEGRERDLTLEDIRSAAQAIAAHAADIEGVTALGVIEDNKKFRRRNTVLVTLVSVLLVVCLLIAAAAGWILYRELFIVDPQRDDIEANTVDLKDANAKLDHLEAFVERVESDEPEAPDPQLAAVFKAIFETRRLICSSSDPSLVEACAELEGTP